MRTIQIEDQVAMVDDCDFERLSALRWKIDRGSARSGVLYATHRWRGADGVRHYTAMHLMILPPLDGFVTDHVNRNGLDNRIENLRYATRTQNNHNSRRRTGGTSVFKGVTRCSSRTWWNARINIGNGTVSLGTYNTETEAAQAYNNAARKHFGQFARLNAVPDGIPSHRPRSRPAIRVEAP